MTSQQTENNRTIEINLVKLLRACLKRWWVFMIVMGYLAVVAYGGTKFLIEPTYRATTKIYVNNSQLDSDNQKITTSDMNAASELVKLYDVFLNTTDTLTEIISVERLPYSPRQLKRMLDTAAVNNTQVFAVTVTSTSPEEARRIADAVGEVLPEKIKTIVEGADARVIEHPTLPTEPSGPQSFRNAVLGALLGFLIVGAVIVVRVISDTTIHDEKDVEELTKLPILVCIPDLVDSDKRKKKSEYYAPKKEAE